MNGPDQARTEAAERIEQLADAANHNWGTHYPCLRDDLGDLAHHLRTGKTTPTIERIITVLVPDQP